MILGILTGTVTIGATACLLDKILGTVEVFLVACHLVELAECHLYDGVTTGTMDLSLVRTEGLTYEIGILDSDVQESLLTCSAVVGHCTLDKMTAVIELM